MSEGEVMNARQAAIGAALLQVYVHRERLDKIEAVQEYTITDAIVALMHLANSKGFEVEPLMRSAESHFQAETAVCPDCGEIQDPDQHACSVE